MVAFDSKLTTGNDWRTESCYIEFFSWTEMNKYFEQKNFEPFAIFNVWASFRATRSETSDDLNHNKYDERKFSKKIQKFDVWDAF